MVGEKERYYNSFILDQIGAHHELLEEGIDVNCCDNTGKNALFYLVEQPHVMNFIGSRLICAYLNYQNEQGITMLMHAARHNFSDAVSILLWQNADVSLQDDQGLTALCYARQAGHEPLVTLLSAKMAKQVSVAMNKASFFQASALEVSQSLLNNDAEIVSAMCNT